MTYTVKMMIAMMMMIISGHMVVMFTVHRIFRIRNKDGKVAGCFVIAFVLRSIRNFWQLYLAETGY